MNEADLQIGLLLTACFSRMPQHFVAKSSSSDSLKMSSLPVYLDFESPSYLSILTTLTIFPIFVKIVFIHWLVYLQWNVDNINLLWKIKKLCWIICKQKIVKKDLPFSSWISHSSSSKANSDSLWVRNFGLFFRTQNFYKNDNKHLIRCKLKT